MRHGILAGTGVYSVNGIETRAEVVSTRYGDALAFIGCGAAEDLVFVTRHGPDHTIPPHMINYQANIAALKKLGVERVLGIYAVGSLRPTIAPGDMVLLDQFIDLALGRKNTFFEGGASGLVHTDVTEPYCETLRRTVIRLAAAEGFSLAPHGTYVCFNGPRFETAGEVRMAALLGGDVVGMTGGTEAGLAREAGLHYAAVAYSINYGAGLKSSSVEIVPAAALAEKLQRLQALLIQALRSSFEPVCRCDRSGLGSQKPAAELWA